ncbi:thiamine pyrophosphokinase [Enterococcus phoeniculicola]|jgi:thiamine pyrophosphokinase|uniref:Thiamine diphosphokinase n=1 Tax=Enterococcus phoeniculicola ATCC BAA-412 TaxID=1158610 RepID=R3WNY2_9ENTE|nr:thiamine diphosphokinase [Enterococcus phoeniculicola]EOL49152.1 thiamine pyrophosphokinase [Enterococcus phoeniculicola ATCC BAA-412]EOT70965.1 thiamine pyrophosphokinase [Enterococcus phoeniculicola ATCC BAA-412]OJG70469.1 thiamine pyrophosphokinase [Enterococcus phoeniculicola]
MNILVVAGANPQTWPEILPSEFDIFVGVDRGGLFLLERGFPLDIAIGDFDSLARKEKISVLEQAKEVIESQPEKDDTDTQLALQHVFRTFPEGNVTLIGATGGRLDHLLSNLWLGLEPRFFPFLSRFVLKDRQNNVRFYSPGNYRIYKEPQMKYLAYCCLTPVENLSLFESKYLLENVAVSYPYSYASNEFVTETASFSFGKGIIAVIQSKD